MNCQRRLGNFQGVPAVWDFRHVRYRGLVFPARLVSELGSKPTVCRTGKAVDVVLMDELPCLMMLQVDRVNPAAPGDRLRE